MEYTTALFILCVMFWVLLALATVCLLAWMFVHVQYYTWDKEDRMRNTIIADIQDTIEQKIEEVENEEN